LREVPKKQKREPAQRGRRRAPSKAEPGCLTPDAQEIGEPSITAGFGRGASCRSAELLSRDGGCSERVLQAPALCREGAEL